MDIELNKSFNKQLVGEDYMKTIRKVILAEIITFNSRFSTFQSVYEEAT